MTSWKSSCTMQDEKGKLVHSHHFSLTSKWSKSISCSTGTSAVIYWNKSGGSKRSGYCLNWTIWTCQFTTAELPTAFKGWQADEKLSINLVQVSKRLVAFRKLIKFFNNSQCWNGWSVLDKKYLRTIARIHAYK